jgi:hypothetical protein
MQDQLEDRPEERRRFPRTRCFKGARIVASGHDVVTCIVRNVSAEGARLQLAGIVALPDEFDLCFDSGRRVRQCRMMWRNESDVGIWFAQAA